MCSVPFNELILNVSGYLDEDLKLGLAVNISIQVLLCDVQVLKFLSNEGVVAHGLVVESLRPQIACGYSEMLGTFSLALKFLLNCESLMHSGWFQCLSESVKLNIHFFYFLITLLFLYFC